MPLSVSYIFISGPIENIPAEAIQLVNDYNEKLIKPKITEPYIIGEYIKFYYNDFVFEFNKKTRQYDIAPKEKIIQFLKEKCPSSQCVNNLKYFGNRYPDYTISQLVDIIISDQSLRETTRYRNIDLESYEKKIIDLPDTKYHWLNLMINNQTNEIIGKYDGYIDVDENNITYNPHNSIRIVKEFRGKRLCKDFAKNTYDNVAKKLKVKYFIIYIATKYEIGACHCYTTAAKELGYKISINDEIIDSPSQCEEAYKKGKYTPRIVFNVENVIFYYF